MKTTRKKQPSAAHPEPGELLGSIPALCGEPADDATLYRRILELVRTHVPFEAASIYALDPILGELTPVCHWDRPVEALAFLPFESSSGLTGWVAGNPGPLLLADRTDNAAFDPDTDFGSFLAVPVMLYGEPVGVVAFGAREARGLSKAHAQALAPVSSLLGLVISGRMSRQALTRLERLLDETRRLAQELQADRLPAATLHALVAEAESAYHQISEALAVILGNVQCALAELKLADQKTLSRLRRIEESAIRIQEHYQTLSSIDQRLTRPAELSRRTTRPVVGARR